MPQSSLNLQADSKPLIEARDICVVRDGRHILSHISLELVRGEILTMVGLNGAGKSTLVKVLAGLLSPDSGEVRRKPGIRIGYCPQHAFPDAILPMSARDFLLLADASAGASIAGVLDETGIGGLASQQLFRMSGGEYQRLLLARAILRQPDVLILDEPMAGVDIAGQSDLYELIPKLRDRYGCGVILVSHDIYIVMGATDRVMCINHHLCCSGRPESVAIHPEFVSLFGDRIAKTLAVYKHDHDHSHDLHGDTLESGHVHGDHPRREQHG